MRRSLRRGLAVAAVAAATLVATACSSSGGGAGSAGHGSASGKPVAGGTATYAMLPGANPNYIFPMLTAA